MTPVRMICFAFAFVLFVIGSFYNPPHQGFLTQEAQIEYQSTTSYARQLPSLSVGGTSFLTAATAL